MSEEATMNEWGNNRQQQPLVISERNLPSTEVLDPVSPWRTEDEMNLSEYLDVLIRRKWLVLSVVALIFITTLIVTLSMPKIYKATGTLEVINETARVTKFEDVAPEKTKALEYYLTQVELLKSPAVAERVIHELNLRDDPVVKKILYGNGSPGLLDGLMKTVKAFFKSDAPEVPQLNAVSEEVLEQERILNFLQGNFDAELARQSFIIRVSFTSPDRHLSKHILNAYIQCFIDARMEKRLEALDLAQIFLTKQIERAKIALEKAEEEMNRFAQEAGIVSLDSKMNSIYLQLEEINSALAQAEIKLIEADSVYHQAEKAGPENLPQVLSNPLIAQLKKEYSKLNSEYQQLTVRFHDEYPAVKAVKSRMDTLAKQLKTEEDRIFQALRNEYQTALNQFNVLKARAESQKRLAMDLNERATQYKIMERDVETNKGIYESLLQRTKEIESMVGVSSLNIQVVDQARLPIMPFKPRVSLNLTLAVVMGFIVGIGSAFLLEHYTDTIVNPDEISDRFRVPVLGVLPLVRATQEFTVEKLPLRDPRAPLSEALRTTRVSIQLSGKYINARSFVISSTQPGEGKTTIAVNLAYTFADAGERVILLDGDLRKPGIQNAFRHQGYDSPGLSGFLSGTVDKITPCQATDQKNLFFIPVGTVPPNPVELLASPRFKLLVKRLHKHFDRVIIDGPPHHGFADVLVLSQHVAGVILVSSVGETTRGNLKHFKKAILNVNGNILGCIINKLNLTKRYGYNSYYRYYQAYSSSPYNESTEKNMGWFYKIKNLHEKGPEAAPIV